MKEHRNFTVILPGACNARCSFCFWDKIDASPLFLQNLDNWLYVLNISQCSISGGEPTMSKYLSRVLELLSKHGCEKIVLNTNGTNIIQQFDCISSFVNHVNISRHGVSDEENSAIFGTNSVPNTEQLQHICEQLNKVGIDVNINCVVNNSTDEAFVYDMIRFCKTIGANSLSLRRDYAIPFNEEFYLLKKFGHIKSKSSSSCPVCNSETKLINGFVVNFKHSEYEPSDIMSEIYEFIYHPDGKLYRDWAMKRPLTIRFKKPFLLDVQDRGSVLGCGCGCGVGHVSCSTGSVSHGGCGGGGYKSGC